MFVPGLGCLEIAPFIPPVALHLPTLSSFPLALFPSSHILLQFLESTAPTAPVYCFIVGATSLLSVLTVHTVTHLGNHSV